MVCATPAFASLAEAFPDATLTVLASPLNAPLLLGNPHVDEVLLYEPKGRDRSFVRRWQVLREIRRRRFDLVIAMRTAWDTHLLTALSGARYRVGYGDKPFGRTLTHRLVGGHGRGRFHEVDRNLNLLDVLGVPRATRRPRLYLREEEREFAERWLRDRKVAEAFLLGIHVGASTDDRCYPEVRYAEAANALLADCHQPACVLVFGGPGDDARVESLRRALTFRNEGATSLSIRELMALMARCALMFVNDSGPMHMAAALDVPFVAVFGPGDYVRWMPENPTARLVRPDPNRAGALPPRKGQSSVLEIPVSWVIEAGRSLLFESPSSF